MAVNTNGDTTIDESGHHHHQQTNARRPSFDELYLDAYTSMLRLASLLVDTVDEAEHVVQDAFWRCTGGTTRSTRGAR